MDGVVVDLHGCEVSLDEAGDPRALLASAANELGLLPVNASKDLGALPVGMFSERCCMFEEEV